MKIPQVNHSHKPLLADHSRLTCDSCHATWAPTCLGCHMTYEEQGRQWDHSLQKATDGVWHEKRWGVGAGPPTLGMKDNETIDAFIPGMIMTLDHPELPETMFIRRFARLSPHTTGPSRSCAGCHQSSVVLGLGKGKMVMNRGELTLEPEMDVLADGLPADAWTNLSGERQLQSTDYPRPFSASEIRRLYRAVNDKQFDGNNRDAGR